AGRSGWRFRNRSRLSNLAGAQLQTHGQAVFRHVSTSSSFRVNRLERNDCDRSFLDSFDHLRLARTGNAETAMNNGRYKNQNVAVLGAGLSGSATALLLASEGAQVTVI